MSIYIGFVHVVDAVARVANAVLDALFPPVPDDVMALADAVGVTPMVLPSGAQPRSEFDVDLSSLGEKWSDAALEQAMEILTAGGDLG